STVEMLACPDDIPTLENFAYGDTPTETALRGLIAELLAGAGEQETGNGEKQVSAAGRQGKTQNSVPAPDIEFDVSQYDLANRHDLRPLVLRTALTYLELMGVLRQGTPFYAGYEMRPLHPVEEIVGQYKGDPAQFVAALFAQAKKGRIWYALNPDEMAER